MTVYDSAGCYKAMTAVPCKHLVYLHSLYSGARGTTSSASAFCHQCIFYLGTLLAQQKTVKDLLAKIKILMLYWRLPLINQVKIPSDLLLFGTEAPLRPQPRLGEVQLLQSNSDNRGLKQAAEGRWSYTFFLFEVIMRLFILSVRFKKLNFKLRG